MAALDSAENLQQRSSFNWLQRTHAFALFAFAAFVCFSIAGAHISLGLLSLCLALQLLQSRREPQSHSFALGFEWPLATFVAVCLISTMLSDRPWDSFRNLKNLLTILGAYTVAFSLRTHSEWRKPALWIFMISATGAALWGLIEFALGLSPKVMSTQSTTMTWGAMSAMFILITLFAAMQLSASHERWSARAFFLPQLAALFLSLVRGAYLGFITGVFYLFHRHWKRLLAAAFVLIIVGSLFAPALLKERFASMLDVQHPTILVRLNQWQIATRIIAHHPFFGVGWHDLAGLTRQYAQPDPNLPAEVNHDIFNIGHYHNTYFTLATCLGLFGLAAFTWLLIAVWRSLGKAMRASAVDNQLAFACRAAIVSFLVTGLFDWTLGDAEVVTMFWFLIGAGLGQAENEWSKKEEKQFHKKEHGAKNDLRDRINSGAIVILYAALSAGRKFFAMRES